MELTHQFTVAAPVARVWEVLLDLERIVPCMPGASLTSVDADEFSGTVRVKLGPVTMTFRGQGRFVEKDAAQRRIVVEASGKERSGGGSARVAIRASLREDGPAQTTVDVRSDLSVSGRAGQFGRGMIADVSNRLLGQFTDCLAGKLAGPEPAASPSAAGPAAPPPPAGDATVPPPTPAAESTVPPPGAGPSVPPPAGDTVPPEAVQPDAAPAGEPAAALQRPEAEPIDLLAVTGIRAMLVRLVPYLLVFVVGALVGAGLVAWLG